ncbi:aldose 1-epimerase [Rhizobium lemnae]|uniref:Aldose 1-epimerase n=1 Tax=Rhizobium lemnae TaxID=1214924 RepID=A0ABV8EGT3_9HYPH|nr:aldose 1-epimerase [Rhizobium lemnae]MCJ8508970.1 aldose 1-epimerase [Rhizobium lemnae]
MPSLEVVDIAHGPFTARVIPDWGGRVAGLSHAGAGDILVPVTASEFDPLNWPKAGGYPLFPFHNRIKQAAFYHQGVLHQLRSHPALGGDVMHGPAHQRVWQVTSSNGSSVSLRLDYDADAEWPFAFTAHQQIELDDHGLTVRLKLVNRSDDPMPGCFGWHPYLAVDLSAAAQTDAGNAYVLDAQNLPTLAAPVARQSAEIPAKVGYTLHFRDWTEASYSSKKGWDVAVTADPVFKHIAVHRTERYLCLEPVSAAAGVLNLSPEQRQARDLTVLKPGEAIAGSVRLFVRSTG